MNETFAQASEQATSWPDLIAIVALIAAGCFITWVLFRD